MSVGKKYYPPRVQVDVFNPDNFIELGQITASTTSQTTIDLLKAETDQVKTDADAQNVKFKAITTIPYTSPPNFNGTITVSGTFNGTQTFVIPYTIVTAYYYYISMNFNYVQASGGVSPVTSILVTNTNWTTQLGSPTQQFWSNLFSTGTAITGNNPSFQMTWCGPVFTNVQPSFTITYPSSVNGNSFTMTGKYTVIGIQVIK